jgi:hypothetical protein
MTEPSREHYDYRAQTDATIKTWHLGAVQRGAASICGVMLTTPDDTRAFALKVPAGKRHYETSDDLSVVTCGSCHRSREYAKATGSAPNGALAPTGNTRAADAEEAGRPSRRRARTGDPRADRAAAAADRAAVEPRRRPSRADRAHAKQEQDRARREAAAEAAE